MAMTVADMANVNDDEVASGGGRCCPTTAMTVADAANVDDGEVASGGRNSSKKKWPPRTPFIVVGANVAKNTATATPPSPASIRRMQGEG